MKIAAIWPLALAFSCLSVSFGLWLLVSHPFAGLVVVANALSAAFVSGQLYRQRYKSRGGSLGDLRLSDDDDRQWPEVFEPRHWWLFTAASLVWLAVSFWLASRHSGTTEDLVNVAIAASGSAGLNFLAGALFGSFRDAR